MSVTDHCHKSLYALSSRPRVSFSHRAKAVTPACSPRPAEGVHSRSPVLTSGGSASRVTPVRVAQATSRGNGKADDLPRTGLGPGHSSVFRGVPGKGHNV